MVRTLHSTAVIPAKAGTQWDASAADGAESPHWVPAFAATTAVGEAMMQRVVADCLRVEHHDV